MISVHAFHRTKQDICRAIQKAGGTPYYVGGMVRDLLLGLKPSDCDIEVFGLPEEQLCDVLRANGEVTLAGKSFGVYKLRPHGSSDTIDVSLPRQEYKTAAGHTGFTVKPNPFMSFAEAAYRRDFTINAMGMDPFTGEVIDPYGGKQDLSLGSLIAVSQKFKEDPLRVLRGMQFAGRFDFSMEGAYWTTQYCKELIPAAGELPPERVFGEWYKWASLSKRPSAGLAFLRDAGWLAVYPALQKLVFCPQDPEWHPEGWSLIRVERGLLPTDSDVASSASPQRVDSRPALGEFLPGSSANNATMPVLRGASTAQPSGEPFIFDGLTTAATAGSLKLSFPASLSEAIATPSESLVWTFGTPAVGADEVVRVVFKIPLSRMDSIVFGAVDNDEVFRSIISSVSIFVMNMLISSESSTKNQLHDDSVNSNGSVTTGPARVSVPIIVVDARRSSIDGNILCYFDLAIVRDSDCLHDVSPLNEMGGTYDITPRTQFQVGIGDVWEHTLHVCDAMATICDREGIDGEERATLVLGALCHDLGKPATTSFTEGRWRSPGHAQAGVDVSRDFLDSIGCFPRIRDRILPLVREHMIHINGDINMRMVRRLTMRLGTAQFSHLIHVMEADYSGRPPLRAGIPEGAAKLAELRASLPLKYEGIVLGRHLMEFGLTPGPGFGPILRAALEAQLEGEFDSPETGIEWLQLRSII